MQSFLHPDIVTLNHFSFISSHAHLLDSICCGILHFCHYVSHHSLLGDDQAILCLLWHHKDPPVVLERGGLSLLVLPLGCLWFGCLLSL